MKGIKKEELCRAAMQRKEAFESITNAAAPYELKGILNSEMLAFVTLIDLLSVDHVIESGRARGQSTEIIARYLASKGAEIRFDSIEWDHQSPDTEVASQRIRRAGFPVNMLFGDARHVLPDLLAKYQDTKKLVLIDGPKGIDAALLAISAMVRSDVEAVCIHDIHKDDARLRKLVEKHFPDMFATDDVDYVEAFKLLDAPCWAAYGRHEDTAGWGPYKRGRRVMKSYGPTLVCLFNSLGSEPYRGALKAFQGEKIRSDRRRALRSSFRMLIPSRVRTHPVVRKVRALMK